MGSPNEVITSSTPELSASDGKIAAVTPTDIEDLSKSDLHIDDEAGAVAAKALASGPPDTEISKKVLRKIDFYILPFLCITYGKPSNRNPWVCDFAYVAPRSRPPILGQDVAGIFECLWDYYR